MASAPCLVSACLAGVACRYDGGANTVPELEKLAAEGRILPVCPEVLGGLSIPRVPCEIRSGCVIDVDGTDRSAAFHAGSEAALAQGRAHGCRVAILKARSPSCGVGRVYDGSFSKTLMDGNGVFAALLLQEGYILYTEENMPANVLRDLPS